MSLILHNVIGKLALIVLVIVLVFATVVPAYASPSVATTTSERNTVYKNWTYYQRGTYEQNCLSYARGMVDSWWEWPVGWGLGPSVAVAQLYLKGTLVGYKTFSNNTSGAFPANVLVAYWTDKEGGHINHFTKTIGSANAVRSKWGRHEIFTLTTVNCCNLCTAKFTASK